MAPTIVGFDGSAPARRALELAATRALAMGQEIVLVTIVPKHVLDSSLADLMPAGVSLPKELSRTFQQNAMARLEDAAEPLRANGVKVETIVRAGDAAVEFLKLAEELSATDLIIGRKSFQGAVLTVGWNADAILRGATIPVTLVP